MPDGLLEIWQANSHGRYNHPDDRRNLPLDAGFEGFGRASTDATGVARFATVRPGRVPWPHGGGVGGLQAPHINISIFARGVLNRLATRLYFDGDPALPEDPVLKMIEPARRGTLIAKRDGEGAGACRSISADPRKPSSSRSDRGRPPGQRARLLGARRRGLLRSRHAPPHAALRGGTGAGRRRGRADPEEIRARHRQGLRSRALRSRLAGRGGAPHRHAHRAGGEGAGRRGRQARRRRGGLRALGRHQPGRDRHGDGAAVGRSAAADPEGARRHHRLVRRTRPQASQDADPGPHAAAAGDAAGARPEDRRLGVGRRAAPRAASRRASRKPRSSSSAAPRAACRRWARRPSR